MRRLAFGAALAFLAGSAHVGHEFPFYPSFYPQEITVETIAPELAVQRLASRTLHAYAGSLKEGAPRTAAVESLGAYVLARPQPGHGCPDVRSLEAALGEGHVWHPYPVTPFHADYLHHADLVRTSRASPAAHAPQQKLEIEIVDTSALIANATTRYNGWSGPPWINQGWFHAYLLLAPAARDDRIEETARRLMRANYRNLKERIALERKLVALLQAGCQRLVLGYAVRREHYAGEHPGGVENVGYDALEGLASTIFPRTVKLRDFPWNGWLNVAAPAPPSSAWNPVLGGFSDAFGRLIARAIVDPALFPSPHGTRWIENRVHTKVKTGAPFAVPENALLPQPGTGRLRPVGAGKTATSRVAYESRNSSFHDGTPMNVADILYAYAFAAAWGGGTKADPGIARATALVRERLKGIRFLGVHVDTLAFGEDKLTYEVPRFEIYLDAMADGAAIAPPWTTLPWHLLALFEEGARRGFFTLSDFDPVRDPAVVRRLAQLARELESRAHVPPALKSRVKVEEARARYGRLREFHAAHGHWLVTNGPYLLSRWDGTKAVLAVFRDPTYPKGVGSYDALAVPPKAYVTRIERRPYGAEVHTEVEWVERLGRDIEVARGPLGKYLAGRPRAAAAAATPVCRYLLLKPEGTLVAAGAIRADSSGACRLEFKAAGGGRLALGAVIQDNAVNLPIRIVPWE
jgi:hypothetical protein